MHVLMRVCYVVHMEALRVASHLSKELYPNQSLRTVIVKIRKNDISVSYIGVAEDSALALREAVSLGDSSETFQKNPAIRRRISEDLNPPQDL
jgi:cellobiose phosphorylase